MTSAFPTFESMDSQVIPGRYHRDFDTISVRGSDATTYLNGQLTIDTQAMEEGTFFGALVLEPTGKISSALSVSKGGEAEYLIICEPGGGEDLLGRLRRFVLRTKVEFHLERQVFAVSFGENLSSQGYKSRSPFIFGTAVAISESGDANDQVDPISIERLRITYGRLHHGLEGQRDLTPAALGGVLAEVVSFTKGCYTGQELVARMDSKSAKPPVSLVRFAIPSIEANVEAHLSPPIEVFQRDIDRSVGVVTSLVEGDEDLLLGLGTLKRGVAEHELYLSGSQSLSIVEVAAL